jgi:ketosteroid isomerase-like protein
MRPCERAGARARRRPQIAPPSAAALRTAAEAMRRYQHAAATGDRGPVDAIITDDFVWYAPVEELPGFYRARESAQRLFARHERTTRTTRTVKATAASGTTAAFEVRAEGVIKGREYAKQLLMVFVVRGDRIAAMREYAAGTRWWDDQTVAREAFDVR